VFIDFPVFESAVLSLEELLSMDSALSTSQNPLKEKSVEALTKSLVKTKQLVRPIEVALLRNHRYLVSGRNRTEALKRATITLYESKYLHVPDAETEIKLLQTTSVPVILHTVQSTDEVIKLITASNQSRAMSSTEKGLLNVSATTAFYDITDPMQRTKAIDAVYDADGSTGLLSALAVNAAAELSKHTFVRGDVPTVLTADSLGTVLKKVTAACKRDAKPKKNADTNRVYMSGLVAELDKQGCIDFIDLLQLTTKEVISEKMAFHDMLGQQYIEMPANFAREGIGVTYPEVAARLAFMYQTTNAPMRAKVLKAHRKPAPVKVATSV
jgi:hypothetical protein